MKKRIEFSEKRYIQQFFDEIKSINHLISWSKIANFLGTNRSMLENYRRSKILLSEERFKKLLFLLEEKRQKYFLKKISYKEANWGQVIGGVNAYKINKKVFEKGRKEGALSRKKFGVKYDFDINMPLSEELCEFLGVVIGDGFTNCYGHLYQTQITGDKILDLKYYQNNLKEICKKQFKIDPKIKITERGLRLNIYSKRVFELLTKRFNIPPGVKCYTVEIPSEILQSSGKMLKFVLRGMFNTDGGVGLDRRKIYKKPYIRINYTSASYNLINQVHKSLDIYGIPHSIHETNQAKARQIQINGEENVKKFLLKIGFSNPRHLIKLGSLNHQ